jgi:hypothetical protein
MTNRKGAVLQYSGCLALVAAALLIVASLGDAIIGNPAYLIACGALFAAMLGLWRIPSSRLTLPLLTGVAIAARIVFLLAFPAGDDVNRYIWEGRIQQFGYNPFTLSPYATELFWLRDTIWHSINHKSWPSIYGPLAQMLFAVTSWIHAGPLAFKGLFVLFDLATLWILLALRKQTGYDRRHVWLYALNPLPLVFIAGEAHMESLMVFAITAAAYFSVCKKPRLMFVSLGAAIMIKPSAIIFLAPFLHKQTIRSAPYLLLPAAAALPYAPGAGALWATLMRFGSELHYNGFLFTLLEAASDADLARTMCIVAAASGYSLCMVISPTPLRSARLGIGIFLLCTPTFHPWYLLLMTPFLPLFRSPAWIALHATTLPLAFYFNPLASGAFWHNTWLLFWLEYLPFCCIGAYYLFRSNDHFPAAFDPPGSVSIIIPTLNEEKRICRCLEAIRQQDASCEIVISDGGSTDKTKEKAAACTRVRWIDSRPGRGSQILTGLRSARGDIALILHADSALLPGALDALRSSLNKRRDAVGGSFSARYNNTSLRFRFTEWLNNIRARIAGVSFGDQAQFFRRRAILPALRPMMLMEDIEISLLCKDIGALLFIPRGVISSTRAWHTAGYAWNFIRVISFSMLFLVRRRIGALRDDCADFYRWYYGQRPDGAVHDTVRAP